MAPVPVGEAGQVGERGGLGDFSAWLAGLAVVPHMHWLLIHHDTGPRIGFVSLNCDGPVGLISGCFSWVWGDRQDLSCSLVRVMLVGTDDGCGSVISTVRTYTHFSEFLCNVCRVG